MKKIFVLGVAGLVMFGLCGCVTERVKAPKSIEVVSISVKKGPVAPAPAVTPKPIKAPVSTAIKNPCLNPIVPEKTCPLADMNGTIYKYLILLVVFLLASLAWYFRAGKRLVNQKKIKVKKHAKKKIMNLKDLLGK